MDGYFLGPCLYISRGLYTDRVTAGLDDNLLPVFLKNYTLFYAAAAPFSFPPAMHGVILSSHPYQSRYFLDFVSLRVAAQTNMR